MSRFAYLAYLALMAAGLWLGCRRMGILDRRMVRAIAATVPVFLAFDLVGVARGWFLTDPALNAWILPGGVSLEEIINLLFLTGFSVVLSLGLGRLRHA